MARLEPHDVLFFASPGELRAWLDEHHATAPELWAGFRPKESGLPTITWQELVDEVLCYGWIDSVRMPVEGGAAIRLTPRRRGSIWSARNVGRVEALRAEGRMREAGEAAFAQRREDRTAVYSFERQAAFDAETEAALRAHDGAWAFWEAQPKGYRRTATHWIIDAKRPETRERRLATLVDACTRGERVPQLTGQPAPKPEPA
ncbi:MAG TPA: YdeI/OmpD-associated family protein [Candidatus Limnocylindrales bacterium]|nr:YdeI/OmpD-associated family protein [Candidatus Limnocylindrales bacterium]